MSQDSKGKKEGHKQTSTQTKGQKDTQTEGEDSAFKLEENTKRLKRDGKYD